MSVSTPATSQAGTSSTYTEQVFMAYYNYQTVLRSDGRSVFKINCVIFIVQSDENSVH